MDRHRSGDDGQGVVVGGRAAAEQGTGKRDASNSHQQAGFTAGTVADDDELPANLGHDVCCWRLNE